MDRIAKHDAPTPDTALTTRAASGDDAARRMVVEQLLPRVRSTVHYLAPRDRDADDLVQLAFIEILRSIGSYRGECRLDVWAYRIVIRTVVRYLKRRNHKHPLIEPSVSRTPSDPATPEHNAELSELRGRLRQHLEKLPAHQRSAVVLRYVHGLEVDEIAMVMETPFNTARERLRVAKQKLRHMVTRDRALNDWVERMAP